MSAQGNMNFSDHQGKGYSDYLTGKKQERGPTLDEIRLKDGSPIHYVFLDEDTLVMDKSLNEEAKNQMMDLFERDKEFVKSLNGLSREEVLSLIDEKRLRLVETENPYLH